MKKAILPLALVGIAVILLIWQPWKGAETAPAATDATIAADADETSPEILKPTSVSAEEPDQEVPASAATEAEAEIDAQEGPGMEVVEEFTIEVGDDQAVGGF